MRRSICQSEPAAARAGEVGSWKFIYTTATALPKGARLKFDMGSKGREIDWQIPVAEPKAAGNVIYLLLADSKVLYPRVLENRDHFVPSFEFTLPSAVAVGNRLEIIVGAPRTAKPTSKNGNRAQCLAERRHPFFLYLDPSGKGVYDEPEVFNIDVRGGLVTDIRVLAPSIVMKNRRFDVIVRFEDEFGNLSSNAPDDTLIELTHENIRDNLNWKLFVPETGFLTLPNLYFNEIGVYTLTLRNVKTGASYRSPPIKCCGENGMSLYWGWLHGETERWDSAENIENCLRHIRDDLSLNFFATSPFENLEETSAEVWKAVCQNIAEFNEEDRFSTFLGLQWAGSPGDEGLRHILFAKDNRPLLRKKDVKYSSLKKIYKSFTPKELISIPSFTMTDRFAFDFSQFTPEFERVVEIYNAWGCSERSGKEGSPFPITGKGKAAVREKVEGSIQNALKANCRFGFVAGGLDDRGVYAGFFEGAQEQYPAGLTAIYAKEYTRSALFEALYNRHCYATTGPRIIVTFSVVGLQMGSEIQVADKPGCAVNRHIAGTVAGTNRLKTVEIIRNGKVIKTFKPEHYWMNYVYDDMEPLSQVTINGGSGRLPFVYYYLRVTQTDGHQAWSSPIWIDDGGEKARRAPPRTGKGSAAKAKPVVEAPIPEETADEEE